MNIAEILHARTRAFPQQVAIIDTHRRQLRAFSFNDLERASARVAALLWRQGLRPGEAVLIFQPMSADLYIALSAIFRLGLVAMFLDPAQGPAHIEQCCALYPPQALIASTRAHLLRLRSPALRRIPHKFAIGWPVPGAVSLSRAKRLFPYDDIYPCLPDTPALLTVTSGSTGQPKAALRSHGFLLTQHRILEQSLGLDRCRVNLTTMPIVALANLASGVTCLIPDVDLRYPGAIDPAPLIAQIRSQYVDSVVASPALLARVVDYCRERRLTLSGVTKIFTGGGPVWPRFLDQLHLVAPQARLVAVYGSTEAEPIAKIAHHQIGLDDTHAMLSGRGLLAGSPVDGIQLKIIEDQWGRPVGPYTEGEFAAVGCAPREIGEIVVSGAHVLPGYLHGHGNQESKFQVGDRLWHRTGDAGYLDAQERLWLMGRCAARIEDQHGTLYPFMAEGMLSGHPAVRRAAVISDEGRRLAAVELHRPLSKSVLERLKEDHVGLHLDEIRICKRIPVDKRHNAKIDYAALAKELNVGV